MSVVLFLRLEKVDVLLLDSLENSYVLLKDMFLINLKCGYLQVKLASRLPIVCDSQHARF